MLRTLISCLVALLLLPVSAASQERDRLDHRGELLGWEAVGRLDTAIGSCTGTLIARDLVLTAAHCVVNLQNGQVLRPQSLTFRAGYAHGKAIATRKVTKVVIADGYSPTGLPISRQVQTDLALLRLDREISSTEADPFKIHSRAVQGTKVTLVSYGRGRNESLQRESGCSLLEEYRGGLMTFDCDATFGSSGAPVFTRDNGRLRILSVVSMGGPGADGTDEFVGMSLPETVASMKREMRNDAARVPVSAGAKRIKIGERASGARFVRVGE